MIHSNLLHHRSSKPQFNKAFRIVSAHMYMECLDECVSSIV